MCAFGVLSAIYLDDELAIPTQEIDYIGSNRTLTNKLEAGQTPIAHGKPQLHFSIGSVPPQLANSAGSFPIWSTHQLPLTRLPPSALAPLSPLRRERGQTLRHHPASLRRQYCHPVPPSSNA